MAQQAKYKRRELVIDGPIQLTVVLATIGLLGAIALTTVLVLQLILGADFFKNMSGGDMKHLLVCMTAAYFVISVVSVGGLACIITHRVAGSARVIETCLKGIPEGEYHRRQIIRQSDFLQGLSRTAGSVAKHVEQRVEDEKRLLENIVERLDFGDSSGARELIAEHLDDAIDLEPIGA